MGNLVFQATLGGQVNLVGPNTASTYNLNVPTVSSTLATLAAQTFAGTQTFTLDAVVNGLTVGRGAGAVSTNTAVGASALAANTTGSVSTAVGYQALTANTGIGYNTAVGYQSLVTNTSGYSNTALGLQAMQYNTSGAENAAAGNLSLRSNTTGSSNAAFGMYALYSNTTASANTAVGYQAGYTNTTGNYNTAVGYTALYGNTTGERNVAVGHTSLQSNTTGFYNTAVGMYALALNTTASRNTAVGYQAGYTNSTGQYNTFSGYTAGYSSTGSGNTLIGYGAGYSTTGTSNTFIGANSSGQGSGELITTGSKNTIIGCYNGNQGGLDIRTASNYIVISDGDGNNRSWATSGGAWVWSDSTATGRRIYFDGFSFAPITDNAVTCGASGQRWSVVYAATGTINTSDANTKQDIEALDDAEKRVAVAIKSLIKKYRFKDAVAEKGDAARIHIGAVAQEVAAAFVAEGLDPTRYALFCSDTWYEVNGESQDASCVKYTAETPNAVEVTRLGLRYEELLAFVIAAL